MPFRAQQDAVKDGATQSLKIREGAGMNNPRSRINEHFYSDTWDGPDFVLFLVSVAAIFVLFCWGVSA